MRTDKLWDVEDTASSCSTLKLQSLLTISKEFFTSWLKDFWHMITGITNLRKTKHGGKVHIEKEWKWDYSVN